LFTWNPTRSREGDLSHGGGFNGEFVTNVGYGVQNRVVGGGVPFFQEVNPIPRMYSFSTFNALNKGYIRYSQNPATGNGGTWVVNTNGSVAGFIPAPRGMISVAFGGPNKRTLFGVSIRDVQIFAIDMIAQGIQSRPK
jgi:hypothetical protein